MSKEKSLINDGKSNNSEFMRNKQIEEMAKVIHNADINCGEYFPISMIECLSKHGRFRTNAATELYNAGYRKQIEGEWKQTEEPMGWHDVDCVECSACGESWVLNDDLDFELMVEYWHYCPNCGAKMKGGE